MGSKDVATDNVSAFQDRFLLNLESDKGITGKILKSPLALATKIVKLLFEDNFQSLRDQLDDIKGYTAGINRVDQLGDSYAITRLYPYLFSFHQYVHSSYRARQGKALEELLKEVMMASGAKVSLANKESEKVRFVAGVLPKYDLKARS